MVEEQRVRVEDAMTKMMNEVDKAYLRKMQADMHRCAAKCCDNSDMSLERVHQCVENCSYSLNNAHKFVQGEFEHLQNRLQRCIMQCNDEVRDKMGPNPSESEVSRYTSDFERCAVKCVDNHIGLLPTVMKKIEQVLSKQRHSPQPQL
ncbi:protein FAM136A [Anabrus simplex]|uniref:protein FAM136A n=1 Tax=Anabrus simplex TaxID=316456 RepID=UPI0034DD04DD